jgi:hypothetical protein
VLPEGEAAETFTQDLQSALEEIDEGPLLTTGGPQHIDEAIAVWQEHGAEVICGGQPLGGPAPRYENTLLRVSGETFLEHADALQTEAFGAVSLLVFADRTEQMVAIAGQVEGNLTGAIYSHTGDVDEDAYAQIEPVLRERVGRLLNDQMPTGVAVSPAWCTAGPTRRRGTPALRPWAFPLRCGVLPPSAATTTCAPGAYRLSSATRIPPARCGASSAATGRNKMWGRHAQSTPKTESTQVFWPSSLPDEVTKRKGRLSENLTLFSQPRGSKHGHELVRNFSRPHDEVQRGLQSRSRGHESPH